MEDRTPNPAVSSASHGTTAGDLVHGPKIVHALTFDVEDWFHLAGLSTLQQTSAWANLPSVVERCTDHILETLARHRVRATFFMLGWICQRYPKLAGQIVAAGHEVGIHSYWHHRCDRMTRGQLYLDLKRNINLVQQQSGQQVLGFRAPCLSIAPRAAWVFDVLLDLGLKYDSSVALPPPSGAVREAKSLDGASLLELPLAVQTLGPMRLPIWSAACLRWMPSWLLRRGFAQFEKAEQPVALALVPRDFAPDCPVTEMPLRTRLKHHTRLKHTQPKLEMLISRYRFDTCAAVLGLSPSQGEESARHVA